MCKYSNKKNKLNKMINLWTWMNQYIPQFKCQKYTRRVNGKILNYDYIRNNNNQVLLNYQQIVEAQVH